MDVHSPRYRRRAPAFATFGLLVLIVVSGCSGIDDDLEEAEARMERRDGATEVWYGPGGDDMEEVPERVVVPPKLSVGPASKASPKRSASKQRRVAKTVENQTIIGQLGSSGQSGPSIKAALDPGGAAPPGGRATSDASSPESVDAPDQPSREAPNVRPFERMSEDARSTFAVDVDTGSYTLARQMLTSGQMPRPSDVRVEEFVNYFDYGYPSPDEDAFGVHIDAAPSPFAESDDRYLMRVGVQGERIPRSERKPVHLTFLVDVSGSMRGSNGLELAKRSLRILTRELKPGDTVAIATYASGSRRVLEPIGASHPERILSALERLKAGGSTAMSSGLQKAYDLAREHFYPEHVNRVVVVSDGNANVGPSSHEAILDKIQSRVDEGIRLSTIGFGIGSYRDEMMEQLANHGNGNYFYVDDVEEAKRIFGEELTGTLQIIAEDVKIQVEFDAKAVSRYRLIGYENRNVKDKNFRNEQVDAGEIGAGHTVTALYELEVDAEAKERLATVRVRHKSPRGHEASERTLIYRVNQLHDTLSDAPWAFQFAAAVGGFAERLRESPYAEDLSYELIEEVADASTGDRKRRRRFVTLVRRAKRMNDK